MAKEDLIGRPAEEKFANHESNGVPSQKCRQIVSESLEYWKQFPVERLKEILDRGCH